ncbi:MAG: hypothetical protein IJZ39_02030 [Oscillospiraceae bacterium]|nr:hypothetical protein [Oscillospiraceae bacterium]
MITKTVNRLTELETTQEALERTRKYLRCRLEEILRPNEKILVCFPDDGPASLGGMIGQVLRECRCEPIFWCTDYRWKGLLRQAFVDSVDAIFGPPLLVLGLMKMARATSTPLSIYNAFLAGYPYTSWMTEGIKRGLDCRIWGCYWIGDGPVIAGFTCPKEAGMHIRADIFEARICDEQGQLKPDAQRGALTLHYRPEPGLVYDTQETAKIWHQPCSCGCDDARIVETVFVGDDDPSKTMLEERFLAWSSVLDYRVKRTECGLDLELVVFPGESLPKITSCARLTVRPWNPDADVPFCMERYAK